MKKIYKPLFAAIAVTILVSMSACRFSCKRGSGKQVTENRVAAGFTEIEISGDYSVFLKQDSTEGVRIVADDNIMQYIKTNVSGGRLKIHNSHNICNASRYSIYIGLKNLSYYQATGAIDAVSDGEITAKDIKLKLSGNTKTNFDLIADNVNTTGSGVTEISLKGQASTHKVEISGSGKLNALDFVVAKYDIETSGISRCQINVLNDLQVNSSGMSDIAYRGNPSNVNDNKSGVSTLKKID